MVLPSCAFAGCPMITRPRRRQISMLTTDPGFFRSARDVYCIWQLIFGMDNIGNKNKAIETNLNPF
jgi:hypothetical protein